MDLLQGKTRVRKAGAQHKGANWRWSPNKRSWTWGSFEKCIKLERAQQEPDAAVTNIASITTTNGIAHPGHLTRWPFLRHLQVTPGAFVAEETPQDPRIELFWVEDLTGGGDRERERRTSQQRCATMLLQVKVVHLCWDVVCSLGWDALVCSNWASGSKSTTPFLMVTVDFALWLTR
ncbi:hypothetical protein IE81DRAFT_349672 [Ceraceosorus guamensis]|uniref:Uncharacterized protein n=1 Tax=Ceraceosorus guamensis TaxID=1522189 RepID=A0A316VQT8_9BASI|nr:hypothetical protein IE81DRAFT_349672 [Ceraceosorus guamensis]PWN39977.1 hypothetical protein IE81DRAFT_349672 [Ceraceosorus guamensis]